MEIARVLAEQKQQECLIIDGAPWEERKQNLGPDCKSGLELDHPRCVQFFQNEGVVENHCVHSYQAEDGSWVCLQCPPGPVSHS